MKKILSAVVGGVALLVTPALADVFSTEKLRIFADFRARLESDFDSRNTAGEPRDDRTRIRVRARVGLRYAPDEHWSIGLRLRSGSDQSHQSPHITVLDFDDNDTGDSDFNLDRWYVEGRRRTGWVWVGRNSVPFWQQNELLFDGDVTPVGLAGGWSTKGERNKIGFAAGYFSLPAGMRQFSGNLGGLQVVYSTETGTLGVTAALGSYLFDANAADPDSTLLLNGNGLRDYRIVQGGVQLRLKAGERLLVLGADGLHNTETYSSSGPDPFTAANPDQTDGFVISLSYGGTKKRGDWLVGYYYARIEAFAVNASYAQDDWVRWGSSVETRGSNMQGHELRGGYAFSDGLELIARLYLVEAITTVEDGNRARVDLNYRF